MNESPVFLLMNIRLHQAQKELPVLLFESGAGPPRCALQGRLLPWSHSIHAWRAELHSVDGLPQSVFVHSKYSVEVWAALCRLACEAPQVLPASIRWRP